MSGERVLLLTGATGSVGREVLPRLAAARTFDRILALARTPSAVPPGAHVVPVRGDVTRPDLGLDAGTRLDLERAVTDVVHAAAETRFNRPLEDVRRVNVDGTRHVLDVAARCSRLTSVLHLSTAYVCGLAPGRVPEDLLPCPSAFANTYQQSKHEAESVAAERRGRIPLAIVRMSTPVGRSTDGYVARLNHVHGLLRLLPLRLSPVMAVDPEATVDLVASDWVADALAALVLRPPARSSVLHLCAGDEALPVAVLMEETKRAHEEHGAGDFRLPEIVPAEEYVRVLEGLRRAGLRLAARALEGLEHFLPHLRARQVFGTDRAAAALGPAAPRPSPLETFRRAVRWCLRTGYGATEESATASALARD